ncbi:TetR/AcrR family transcriptional regulator [Actinomycetospora termitidis]|uniref:TetR/AcrR family transcriptional regulator n=1 Tax=Actinomycetospora termitidis TaxID=3053470 RepID=A0ABT7M6G9_9PSEU|nr:TetR/AcrR family transcriptional regulator [Actinomycetospora sp. Odt1-22]MDL5156264.1 TetR/AcrR family transcriptional regulator [Actinomycetospora sp. Odt1-22]
MSADPQPRQRDAERTRAEILDVATEEFSTRGLAGARVDEIAARTRTTKRMLYYYFGSKDGLYLAVLERAYLGIRALESHLAVDGLPPTAALRRLCDLTFDHHEAHPDFIRLVSIENIHHAEHLRASPIRSGLSGPALDVLERILARGRDAGLFRDDVDALDIHLLISSFCIFRTANRHTIAAIFDRDMLDPDRRDHYRRMLADLVVEFLTAHVGRA